MAHRQPSSVGGVGYGAERQRLHRGCTVDERYESALIEWAHTYNGYERLAGGAGDLWELVRPLHEEFERTGKIPEWAGVDLLRGWAFYLVRSHRHGGAYEPLYVEYPAVLAIVDAINRHPAARPEDRAPEPERGALASDV